MLFKTDKEIILRSLKSIGQLYHAFLWTYGRLPAKIIYISICMTVFFPRSLTYMTVPIIPIKKNSIVTGHGLSYIGEGVSTPHKESP